MNPKYISSGGEGITDSTTHEPVPIDEKAALEVDCPCGCGDRVLIPLHPSFGKNSWSRQGDDFNTMTISPSVQRRSGCNTHFSIINGGIIP